MVLIISLEYSVKREWNRLNGMCRHMSGECRGHCTMLVAHENALKLHLTIWHTKPYSNHTKSYLPTGCMRQANDYGTGWHSTSSKSVMPRI
jgi:hypothetical protein